MCFFLMQVMQVFVFKQTKNNKRFHETPTGGGFYKEFFPEFGEMIQTFDPQLLTFSKDWATKNLHKPTRTETRESLRTCQKHVWWRWQWNIPKRKPRVSVRWFVGNRGNFPRDQGVARWFDAIFFWKSLECRILGKHAENAENDEKGDFFFLKHFSDILAVRKEGTYMDACMYTIARSVYQHRWALVIAWGVITLFFTPPALYLVLRKTAAWPQEKDSTWYEPNKWMVASSRNVSCWAIWLMNFAPNMCIYIHI